MRHQILFGTSMEGTTRSGVSIIICTRNRASALAEALNALKVAVPAARGVRVEVLLIDSASGDETPHVLVEWAKSQSFPVTVARAEVPGLSVARNIGIKISRGIVLAMTDDDCRVTPGYVEALLNSFSSKLHPIIVGGRIELGDPADLPITIKTDSAVAFFRGIRMPSGFIMGANIAMTYAAVEQIGLFDERFGAGAPLISAEDTDYLVRALLKDIPVIYNPELTVHHFHGRREITEARNLYAGYSFGDGAIFAKYILRHPFVIRTILARILTAIMEIFSSENDPLLGRRKTLWRLKHQARGFSTFVRLSASRAQTQG